MVTFQDPRMMTAVAGALLVSFGIFGVTSSDIAVCGSEFLPQLYRAIHVAAILAGIGLWCRSRFCRKCSIGLSWFYLVDFFMLLFVIVAGGTAQALRDKSWSGVPNGATAAALMIACLFAQAWLRRSLRSTDVREFFREEPSHAA